MTISQRSRHVVAHSDGRLACRGVTSSDGWKWERIAPNTGLPAYVLTWETHHGAQLFANMNGGKPKLVTELTEVAA